MSLKIGFGKTSLSQQVELIDFRWRRKLEAALKAEAINPIRIAAARVRAKAARLIVEQYEKTEHPKRATAPSNWGVRKTIIAPLRAAQKQLAFDSVKKKGNIYSTELLPTLQRRLNSGSLKQLEYQEKGTKAHTRYQMYRRWYDKKAGRWRFSNIKRDKAVSLLDRDWRKIKTLKITHPGLPARNFILAGQQYFKIGAKRDFQKYLREEVFKIIGADNARYDTNETCRFVSEL